MRLLSNSRWGKYRLLRGGRRKGPPLGLASAVLSRETRLGVVLLACRSAAGRKSAVSLVRLAGNRSLGQRLVRLLDGRDGPRCRNGCRPRGSGEVLRRFGPGRCADHAQLRHALARADIAPGADRWLDADVRDGTVSSLAGGEIAAG